MERTERMAGLIDDLSVDDLRRTTLQAIDHAYKSAAEVNEATAKFQGALGTIAELRDENRRLREALGKRGVRSALAARQPAVRRTVARSVHWARRQVPR